MSIGRSSEELRQQLRSLFALLRAIVRHSAEGERPKLEYASKLECRIGALARAQDMLMRAPQEGIDLEELVLAEMLAQAVPERRYRVTGPAIRIGHDAAAPLALAVHELATNAVLHGVLGESDGRVEVSWDHEGDGSPRLRLLWEERANPERRQAPTTKGFGLELLERTLPYELDACIRVDWAAPGVRIEISLPPKGKSLIWCPGEKAAPA